LVIAVGVDVAEERKGLDLVALDANRRVAASRGRLTVEQVASLVLDELQPDIVCIDSPSGWSRSGRSRQAERELAKLRISAYATGADPGDHSFYGWMRVGFSVFEALADHYPLFRGDDPHGRAAEVFPNASAAFLAGRQRDKAESKLQFRRQVLRARGVAEESLPGIDRVDAALAALTGLLAVEGQWSSVGHPDEGVILLPVWAGVPLPPTISVAAGPVPASPIAGGRNTCGCGCGAEVRRRYLPGHDAKLKSRLLRAWRLGDLAAEERLLELGWLPHRDRPPADTGRTG
jgi:predicted nuclease with RNAse H fold